MRGTRSTGRRSQRLLSVCARVTVLVMVMSLAQLAASSQLLAPTAAAATTCPSGGCAVTVDARDFPTGDPLANFSYVINADNTKLPGDPLALSTESNSPIVAEGDQGHTVKHLPAGRYLVSVRSLDHKMWGQHFTLPSPSTGDGSLTARVDLTVQSEDHPLPLGKIRVFVFQDNTWTNGAPDTEEGGLGGFQVGLEEQTGSEVTVDYNNDPLCGGVCKTANDGFVSVDDLGPATYFIDVHPPDGPCNSNPNSQWYQTTTIDGGLLLMAPTEEGADGTGSPGEQLWEPPDNRTAYWFGFVCSPRPFTTPGTGEVTGQARNWVEWAPYTTGTFNDPVENPLVALSDATTDQTLFVGRGDGDGNFDIQNVPAGDYNLSIWDEQLSYIMRFKPVTVAAGQTVDVNDVGDDGVAGIGVSRWFGWLDGHVYKDLNGNGKMDSGEPTIANTDVDQRWRDGSIKESTVTDANGYYQYPTAEGGALGRWIVNEQGFSRFSSYPGPSVHDEHTGDVIPSCSTEPPSAAVSPCIPTDQGGGLLTNQLILEGHRATVDWGKRDYAPGTPGQIVGITYFSTTRNEFFADKQAHENYEPAIPDATVYLETPGPDGLPNTPDDVVVNKYVTDHWQQPNSAQDPQDPPGNTFTQSCAPIRDFLGNDVTSQVAAKIAPNCLEVPLTGQNTKDGAFDGGYAFADYCPGGYDLAADDGTCVGGSDPVALVAGNYITHAIMPNDAADDRPCNSDAANPNVSTTKGSVPGDGDGCLYRPVKEEDVNVDLGNHFVPQIPPPPCVGDDHLIDKDSLTPRSPLFTTANAHAPLCDKKLVVLQNGQNANADFNLMTNFRTDPNGQNAADNRTGDVPEPGRLVGQVFNDIYFERNQASPWYGEPRPIAGIPVGIYARVDTVCANGGTSCAEPNVNAPYDSNHWRLLTTVTTSPDGSFEVLVPSTETLNCPIPQGPCPGMYLVTVDDPGSKEHPNANFNPNLLVATTPAEAWPGLTDQLDLPLDPISGTACEDPAGGTNPDPSDPARPEVLQVSRPYVLAGDAGADRQITIQGDFIGTAGPANATGGRVTLTDDRTGVVTTLTRAPGGGILSWTPGSGSTPDTVVIQVPAVSSGFTAGPKQLGLTSSTANGSASSVNGITLHVFGGGAVARVDTAKTISDPHVVLDPAVVAADTGRAITAGSGIPAGTTITAVTPGVSLTMNNPATQAGTRTLAITKTDPAAVTTNNSSTVVDPAVVAADVGRTVSGAGIRTGVPTTITSVNLTITVGHPVPTFTMSRTANATLAAHALTFTKSDAGTTISNSPAIVFDPAAVAGDVGATVSGAGIPAGATVASVVPGTSFTMNLSATATSPSVAVTLTSTQPTYSKNVVNVPAPPPVGSNTHALQDAIDAAPAGSLLVLSPGVYNENVVQWKPLVIQGLGAGGIIGAHELQARDPEDPRFNVSGTVIDGRYFPQNATDFDATVATNAPYAGVDVSHPVLRGADVTVLAKSTAAYDLPSLPANEGIFSQARIDGVGLSTGRGDGAGGIQVQAFANNLQITNDYVENNGGIMTGGIGIGQLFDHDSHNYNVRVANSRLTGNGGLTTSGGVGIFYGSNGYDVGNNIICSNFSVEYGAGLSHIGLSPGGKIHDNKIFYNDSVDSGAGIAIESELVVGSGSLGDGSGAVDVDRNLIQSNYSGDDGGGIFVLDALQQPINIRNNMVVDNGASDMGGGIVLDDSSNVRIVNTTVANNVTTGSSENSAVGVPHAAGLATEANDPLFQATLTSHSETATRTNGSTTVADTSSNLTAADVGKRVSGTGISTFLNSTILSVNPGVGFVMSRAAIGSGTGTVTITAQDFSNPVLFNDIFWDNDAMTLDGFGPGATLVDQGFIDFEIRGTTRNADTFTPRYSTVTNNLILGPDGVLRALPPGQGNRVGENPLFVTPFTLELTVSGSRLDPQAAAVTITGSDPPVGLTGDYHLQTGSPAVDRGVRCNYTPFPTPATSLAPCTGTGVQAPTLSVALGGLGDYDGQYRPQQRVFTGTRGRAPWDLGADEVPGTNVTLVSPLP